MEDLRPCAFRSSSRRHPSQFLPASTPHLGPTRKLSSFHGTADKPSKDTRILEVERKFVACRRTFERLRRQNNWPGPELVERLFLRKGCTITDIYHDTADKRLLEARVYLRQRNNEWQLKVRRTGGLLSTGCIEVCGKARIELALRSEGSAMSLSCLEQVAKMETVRRPWGVGGFAVSVDDSLLLLKSQGAAEDEVLEIPHKVGEVELCEEVEEKDARRKMEEMTKKIDKFMERYEEVFQGRHDGRWQPVPEGKLAAYFRSQSMLLEQQFLLISRWSDNKGGLVPISQLGRAGNICWQEEATISQRIYDRCVTWRSNKETHTPTCGHHSTSTWFPRAVKS